MTGILIIGGTGFIGRHLAAALTQAGHTVTAHGRRSLDLVRDDPIKLADTLRGMDYVINAAGLIQDAGTNSLSALHVAGTNRLITACRSAHVSHLIHLSALGAASDGRTVYHRTKGDAEAALDGATDLDIAILRPSLVIGPGGASTLLFSALAALPLTPRLGPGTWRVQPIHVDDLAALVVRLVALSEPMPHRIDVVGPEPITTDRLTRTLGHWLGFKDRPFMPIPTAFLWLAGAAAERITAGPINRPALRMLRAGNAGDPAGITRWLDRPPRPVADALTAHPAGPSERLQARLRLLRPFLRISLAFLWIWTGLMSVGLYPIALSYRRLDEIGLSGMGAELALFGGANLDLGLGLLLLIRVRPVLVGYGMLACLAAFTLLSALLPTPYWLDPFAPLIKNLPIAAALLVMMAMEA